MKRLKLFFLPAALILLLAAGGWWMKHLSTRYRHQLQAQPATAARWERQIQQLRQQRDAARHRLDAARQQPAVAALLAETATAPDLGQAGEIVRWVRSAQQLKQAFERRPEQKIPELALLDDRDWLRIARRVQLEPEDNLQRALAMMRNEARSTFVQWLQNALRAYLQESDGVLPTDPAELRPYFDPRFDPALFAGYEIVRSGKLSEAPAGSILKAKSVVNDEYDERYRIERTENGALQVSSQVETDPEEPRDDGSPSAQIEHDLAVAVRAFIAKNSGALPTSPAELIPYFDPPLGPALTEMFRRPMTPEQRARFPDDIAQLAAGRRLER